MNQYPSQESQGHLRAASLQWGASVAPFSTNLCDCCDNFSICCKGCFAPCCLYGDITEHLYGNRDDVCCHCILCCFFPCTWGACCMGKHSRKDLRKKYGLKSGSGDCCVHCCCHACAMCQELREIEFRGEAMASTQEMIKSRSNSSPNELRRSQSNPPMIAIIPGQNDGTVMEMVPARSNPAVIQMVPAQSNPAMIQMVPAQRNPTMMEMVQARSNPPMVHENSGPVFFVAVAGSHQV